MDKSRDIVSMKVIGIEKRYLPSRHYMYILKVRWTDSSVFIIYRNYSAFFFLHSELLENFPIEAGCLDDQQRVIPELPGKVWFGRSEIKTVAEQRSKGLNSYCQELMKLESKLSQSPFVKLFVEVRPDDLDPPKNANKKPDGFSALLAALLPFSFSKKEAKESKPAKDMVITEPLLLETYLAIASYKSVSKTEVSFQAGDHVDVVEKNENGWWFVQVSDQQGWAPASYLDPLESEHEAGEPQPNYVGDKYLTTRAYEAVFGDEVSFPLKAVVEVIQKILDGWWIIKYNDKVGYAPAQYLKRYDDPNLDILYDALPGPVTRNRDGSSAGTKLTPRRHTIKNIDRRFSRKKSNGGRDLQMIARMSIKVKGQREARAQKRRKEERIDSNGAYAVSRIVENAEEDDDDDDDAHDYEEPLPVTNGSCDGVKQTGGLPPPKPPRIGLKPPKRLPKPQKPQATVRPLSVYDDVSNINQTLPDSPTRGSSMPFLAHMENMLKQRARSNSKEIVLFDKEEDGDDCDIVAQTGSNYKDMSGSHPRPRLLRQGSRSTGDLRDTYIRADGDVEDDVDDDAYDYIEMDKEWEEYLTKTKMNVVQTVNNTEIGHSKQNKPRTPEKRINQLPFFMKSDLVSKPQLNKPLPPLPKAETLHPTSAPTFIADTLATPGGRKATETKSHSVTQTHTEHESVQAKQGIRDRIKAFENRT